jgi:nucleoside-diphosphate-sugar epimerase
MPERGTLDISKARDLLGYAPAFPLERGYKSYIQWYKTLAAEKPSLFGISERFATRMAT